MSLFESLPDLKPGDLIRIVSPAGPIEKSFLDQGIGVLKSWGYQIEIAPHALSRTGYLAGSDKQRANDLTSALIDANVKCVLCSRGGYGSARLLHLLDWNRINKSKPKIVVGFSDISALMINLWSRCGWISFFGPQAGKSLASASTTRRTKEHLKGMLDGSNRDIRWNNGKNEKFKLIKFRGGRFNGILVPSTLSILVSLIGTPFFPDLSGKVLCLEEVNEAPYRIDRMFWQLNESGALKDIAGCILGDFVWDQKNTAKTGAEILANMTSENKFPIYTGLPFGHIPDRMTIPIGINVRINDKCEIIMDRSA